MVSNNQFVLSKAEAAKFLNISNATIHRLIKAGSLPASKILSRIVIRRDDCETFLEQHRI